MLKKMQRRFIIAAMTAFGVVMFVLITGINILNHYQTTVSQDEIINGILEYDQMITSQPGLSHPPINEMSWAGGSETEFTTRFFIVHCNDRGEIKIFGNDYISSIDKATAETYTKAVLDQRRNKGYYKDYRYIVKENAGDLTLVFLNIADSLQFKQTLLFVSVFIGLFSLLAVFVLVLIFSRPATKPFIKNIERQKRFITDASHELKTPITSIATSADIIAMEYENDEWIHNIQRQTARLTKLVNELVMLSRLDEEMPFPEKTTFSLSEAAWEITEPFAAMAKACGKTYTQSIDDNLSLYGDRNAIQQMLSILLDNAVKYSSTNGEIRLSIYGRRNKIYMELFNTCNLHGIVELDHLFDRFYRPDESRSTNTGGYGIGLSIAQAIAVSHGGKISVSTPDQKSILFRVIL
ncbi:MAG: HAMP domain-containing histidine kinase [Roseburia sp.]|nr:HAMP domain-containing histidine kinase [Roseburia sp.]